ncbi:ankyrin repeat-containing protein ITN1 [Prunus yedoensis var. nudiflora]|uniref:Ankyrin repeat-containing protein ITN1 n=1 Tax=Prunus yedoensis var. nudiflora TaxID=2094558 RepID=A0A314XXB7_PRUYE|nr:ankyrin repeat-containing protein ITN1 [Prunus yedoensis var. nudiflora]
MAVKGTNCEVVKLLLEADSAIVMLPDKFGNTALHVATRKKRAERETKAEKRVVEIINKLMWLASVCTSVAFMASSYIVVGRHHRWAAILVTIVGGMIMAAVLGTMTYYVVKSKRIRSTRKKEKHARRSGSNSWMPSDYSNSEIDRIYAL